LNPPNHFEVRSKDQSTENYAVDIFGQYCCSAGEDTENRHYNGEIVLVNIPDAAEKRRRSHNPPFISRVILELSSNCQPFQSTNIDFRCSWCSCALKLINSSAVALSRTSSTVTVPGAPYKGSTLHQTPSYWTAQS